ncbi:MAG: glycosyl transferase [Candidatus Eisenbacteria bacterium]|nr:glycosyl transferase [Candidatus Eisenbacteria bacterium]
MQSELRRTGRDVPGDPARGARLLSNGSYRLVLTGAGTGASSWGGYALTRWRGERLDDHDGVAIYLRDLAGGPAWTVGLRPAGGGADEYSASWEAGRLGVMRRDGTLHTELDACVAADRPLEARRLSIHNRGAAARDIEVTTCCEVALNHPAADAGHPAFSKLFIQTSHDAATGALLARRRPRGEGETHPWMVHLLLGPGELQHETDRARFLGRGRTLAAPVALDSHTPLSGTTGSVLDPVLCLRRTVRIEPGGAARLTVLLGAATEEDAARRLVSGWERAGALDGLFGRAAARERDLLDALGISLDEAERFQGLAAAMLYQLPALRDPVLAGAVPASAELLRRLGLDPDLPLVMLDASVAAGPARRSPSVALDLRRAHAYWCAQGLPTQAVLLCDDPAAHPVPAGGEPGPPWPEAGFRVLRWSEVGAGELQALFARAVLLGRGALPEPCGAVPPAVEPVDTAAVEESQGRPGRVSAPNDDDAHGTTRLSEEPLRFFNGWGGFSQDGREYVVHLPGASVPGERRPPMPWTNVVSNEDFGFLVSESGAGSTWCGNSREHRLTPWSNDPLADPHGEALYLRDEESGRCWSPLPGPIAGSGPHEVRHGLGYTRFRSMFAGLHQDVCMFVPARDPVKLVRVRLANRGRAARRLSLFSYQRLVLGVLASETAPHVVTEMDAAATALLAWTPAAGEFADRVAFAAPVLPVEARALRFTADREEFLGLDGGVAAPAALRAGRILEGRAGPGLDPCFAQQVVMELPPGTESECVFLLGEGASRKTALELIERYREPGAVARAFDEARAAWDSLVSGIEIATPAPGLDVMVNAWLPYQALACRIHGRTAFYQSGGAFGFRDQLQDTCALTVLDPGLTRRQILLHAAHQFVEGDVLHWWHPPRSRGIRTRFADDLLWLPYAAAGYVRATGDWAVLEEEVRFLAARALRPGEDEAYLQPAESGQAGDVYEHCVRALDRSLDVGSHGLPLFGTGDWNDGMNRVGRGGHGESVWMGFFLYAVLGDFLPACERRGDAERAARYRAHRARLREALHSQAWDGEWYLRAWYDDGTPLGSAEGDECRIDALAQAWAVLSGAAPPDRAARAMDAVEEHLVSEAEGLIRLLAPPFENTAHDPGYIKGYVAGVRENGGQYTHAALWVVRALAELGRADRAARLLEMLGPVAHTSTPEQVRRYQVEPYVVAADVYGAPPHAGRGGWTWYTGSAGWMYRVALESVLGLTVEGGDTLRLKPCVPPEWPEYRVRYRVPGTGCRYDIQVINTAGGSGIVKSARLDGAPIEVEAGAVRVPLTRGADSHRVDVVLG